MIEGISSRGRIALICSVGGLAVAVATLAVPATGADKPAAAVRSASGKTIGLAITSLRPAFVETGEASECANGLQDGEVAQLRATPGAIDRLKAEGGSFENRGPNGETGQNSPLDVKDYLPFHELITKTGFGVNLDGTPDGRATPKTCAHEKFTNAEGEKVDHQAARVFGCTQGYRIGGQTAEGSAKDIYDNPVNRYLLEVTGVDSEINDPSVQVNFYKGLDRLIRVSDSTYLAGLSQRVDASFPEYQMKTTGRIVNGMLITDPIPQAYLPLHTQQRRGDRDLRDLTLRLKLDGNGAKGLMAGYENWRKVWNIHTKKVVAELNKHSSPNLYQAFVKYADGYPDPKTGLCTYISSSFNTQWVRSIIVHEKDEITARIANRN